MAVDDAICGTREGGGTRTLGVSPEASAAIDGLGAKGPPGGAPPAACVGLFNVLPNANVAFSGSPARGGVAVETWPFVWSCFFGSDVVLGVGRAAPFEGPRPLAPSALAKPGPSSVLSRLSKRAGADVTSGGTMIAGGTLTGAFGSGTTTLAGSGLGGSSPAISYKGRQSLVPGSRTSVPSEIVPAWNDASS